MDVFHITLCGSRGINGHITVSQKRDGCVRLARNYVIAENQYWKNNAVKHGESAKYIDANKTKHSVLKIIHEKGI